MSEALAQVLAKGRAAYPLLASTEARLVPILEARLVDEKGELDGAELYLAAACAAADPTAIATFERLYFGVIGPSLSRMGLPSDAAAEIAQTLRVRLFVAQGDDIARVVTYAGRGQLAALVRVAAVREGLGSLRQAGRLVSGDDGLEELPEVADDAQLAHVKAQHRDVFKAAFEAAAGELVPRQRTLLRLAIVEQLGIDRIAGLYAVHRATAARWIADARAELSKQVHRKVAEALRVAQADVDELASLVESQLELSLSRILKKDA